MAAPGGRIGRSVWLLVLSQGNAKPQEHRLNSWVCAFLISSAAPLLKFLRSSAACWSFIIVRILEFLVFSSRCRLSLVTFMCARGGPMCLMAYVWRSEDILWESVLPVYLRSWGSSVGHQAWPWVPSPTELSRQPISRLTRLELVKMVTRSEVETKDVGPGCGVLRKLYKTHVWLSNRNLVLALTLFKGMSKKLSLLKITSKGEIIS